jgi:hypothetical protein
MRFPPNNTAITTCPDCGATVPKALAGNCPTTRERRSLTQAVTALRGLGAAINQTGRQVHETFAAIGDPISPRCPGCGERHPRNMICPMQVNWSRLSGPLPEDGSFADIDRLVRQRRRASA